MSNSYDSALRVRPDVAEVPLRMVTGGLFVPHGGQKLLGWAGGSFDGTAAMMGKIGLPFPELTAALAGGIELFGGLCLMLGLFTRAAAALCLGLLVVAFFILLPRGFFWTQGGYEYVIMWAVACLYFVLRGGQSFALSSTLPSALNSKWLN